MFDAVLDRWLVAEDDDTEVLLGFALRHNEFGGLSWIRSSPIAELDEEALSRTPPETR